jgi:hypothetical protein
MDLGYTQLVYAHEGEDSKEHHMMEGDNPMGFWGGRQSFWFLGVVVIVLLIILIMKK